MSHPRDGSWDNCILCRTFRAINTTHIRNPKLLVMTERDYKNLRACTKRAVERQGRKFRTERGAFPFKGLIAIPNKHVAESYIL